MDQNCCSIQARRSVESGHGHGCRSGSHRDTFLGDSILLLHCHAPAVPRVEHAKWEGPPDSRSLESK